VVVGPEPGRADRGTVLLEVVDTGEGFDPADIERVFERFYRADSARASSDGGAGLGLAIAQWIVGLHGGDIHPEHRDPHGCRMVVTLPDPSAHPSHAPAHSPTNQEPRSHR